MAIIQKKFKGMDGKDRLWAMNTETKILFYMGFASDFQDRKITEEDLK